MQFMPTTYLSYTTSELPTSSTTATPTNNTVTQPGSFPYGHEQQQQQQQQHQAQGVPQPQQLPYPTPVGMPPLPYPTQQQQPATAATQSTGGGPMVKPKRRQVKNACVNCQKACKKCDDARPCPRCIKYGITATCVNSVRKERKKGVKRGPYKRRNDQDLTSEASAASSSYDNPTGSVANNSNASSTLLSHGNPYFRYGEGYPHGTIVSPYTVPSVMQQMYPATYPTTHPKPETPKPVSTKASADSDEEGSKLTILSQLCSAVLDHSDQPKEEVRTSLDDTAANGKTTTTTTGAAGTSEAASAAATTTPAAAAATHPHPHPSNPSSEYQHPSMRNMYAHLHHPMYPQMWALPPVQQGSADQQRLYYPHPHTLTHTAQQQQQQTQPQQQQQHQQHQQQQSSHQRQTQQQHQETLAAIHQQHYGNTQWNASPPQW